MNVGNVLTKLVDILRGHKYYIEGHLAALLTNLIVLEGLAKDLDEEINIIGKAASFLLNLGNFAIKDVVK